ncbi:MAG: hypothetical protein ABIJ56_21675 [Pseudomonadota bacterium]
MNPCIIHILAAFLSLCMLACRGPAGKASGGPGAKSEAAPPAAGDPRDVAETYMGVIKDFCLKVFTRESVIKRFAPNGAIEARGKLLQPGTAFYSTNEVVTTLYTTDTTLQVVWWKNSKDGKKAISEIHLVPETKMVVYKEFVEKYELGEGTALEQGHQLADIPHKHAYTCQGGKSIDVILNEAVWKGEVVGKIGEIGLFK